MGETDMVIDRNGRGGGLDSNRRSTSEAA